MTFESPGNDGDQRISEDYLPEDKVADALKKAGIEGAIEDQLVLEDGQNAALVIGPDGEAVLAIIHPDGTVEMLDKGEKALIIVHLKRMKARSKRNLFGTVQTGSANQGQTQPAVAQNQNLQSVRGARGEVTGGMAYMSGGKELHQAGTKYRGEIPNERATGALAVQPVPTPAVGIPGPERGRG